MKGGGSQVSDLDYCDQVVNLREEQVKPLLALNDCRVAKWVNTYRILFIIAVNSFTQKALESIYWNNIWSDINDEF
jgi:hypothetical protein